MSFVLVTDCPFCKAENTAFSSRTYYAVPDTKEVYWMMFECNSCHSGVLAKGQNVSKTHVSNLHGNFDKYFAEVEVFPKLPPVDAPEHLPPEVLRLYIQAAECRAKGEKMLDAAGMTYRKTLETALKLLSEDSGIPLVKRIEKLAGNGQITKAMATWAHEIRLDGNEAAHGEAPERKEIDDLHYFVHVFLLYAFTLPAMVADRKTSHG